jgi:hypothetical protein
VVLLAACLASATTAAAQTAPNIPRWDVSTQTGVFLNRPSDGSPVSWDPWYAAANVGVSAGRYLTEHLKLEGEVTFSNEGERYVTRVVQVPGVGPYPVGSEQMMRTTSASGVVAWQFLENRWAHPFVFAGAALDVEDERIRTWRQSIYRGDPRIPGSEVVIATEQFSDLGSTARTRALFGAGAKLYVGSRAYFRTDTRVGVGSRDSVHVSIRVGFGTDF